MSVGHVKVMHAEALDVGGGMDGVRDAGLLDSAVMAPQSGYLTSLAEMTATYAHGIAKNHAFVDGNKRTAVYAMLAFLEVNGITLTLPEAAWEKIMQSVASGATSRDDLGELIAAEIGRREDVAAPPLWVDLEEDDGDDPNVPA